MFRASQLHQGQVTVVGRRIGQAYNFSTPRSTLPPNLEAAHRFRTLARRTPTPTPQISSHIIHSQGQVLVTLCLAVYAAPSKPDVIAKLVPVSSRLHTVTINSWSNQLSDLQDAFGAYPEGMTTSRVFRELSKMMRAQYTKTHEENYGSFPYL